MQNDPLIITCAPVGAELTKKDLPNLPVTPDEIAKAASEAVRAGASIIHLHVRDEWGRPSQKPGIFQAVTAKIRECCDCIIQYSTGGAVGTALRDREAPLALKPDMGTLSMGSMNFGADIFENTTETIRHIAHSLKTHHVMPELEIFDWGMVDNMITFQKQPSFPEKFHINFVLGVPGGMSGEISNLIHLIERLPQEQTWSVSGIGRYQLPLTTVAIALGGHVRVGFEDNIYYHKNEPALSNAQFVERIVRISQELNRPPATVAQSKMILGIPQIAGAKNS